jgi:hypothetical protein
LARARAYHILGVSPVASHAEVRRAYLERLKVVHPDRFDPKFQPAEWQKANDMLLELNAAYEEIKKYPGVLEAVPGSSAKRGEPVSRIRRKAKPWYSQPLVAWGIPMLILVVLFLNFASMPRPAPVIASSNPMPAVAIPAPLPPPIVEPVRDLPQNGYVARFQERPEVAPFTVIAAPEGHHVVKLEEAETGVAVLMMFVHAGQTAQTKIPLGNYRLKYATGTTWFGEQHLFGPGTSYQQADRTLGFVKTPTGYSGHTIQLIRQVNGNLPTSALPANRW